MPCILEMAILLVEGNSTRKNLYTFYNHRICKKLNRLDIKYLKSFKFCQSNIHGIQDPNYESCAQLNRRRVYDKIIKSTPELESHIVSNDLSCFKIRKILWELFDTDFKNVVNIYFKGGDFEKGFFRDFVYSNVNIVDLGVFDILRYMYIIKDYDVCSINRHKMLCKKEDWTRHCPQYEVLSFYEFAKLNL